MDSRVTRAYAEKWLWIWGEQMRVRLMAKTRTPYIGNIDAGSYRPKDDPHPHAFVVCQVETCLNALSGAHRAHAWHFYAERRHREDFYESRWKTGELKRETIDALAAQMGTRLYATVVEKGAHEILEELRRLRQLGKQGTLAGVF